MIDETQKEEKELEEIQEEAVAEAAPAEAPAEEPVEAPVEEPVEAPVEEPAEAPAEEPAEAPADEPAEAPVEEPVEAPVEEPVEAPAEEPVEAPVEEPAEAPVEELVEASVEEPVEEPQPEPVAPVAPQQVHTWDEYYTHSTPSAHSSYRRRRSGVRILLIILSLVLVGALAFAGWYFFMRDTQEETEFLTLPKSVQVQTITASNVTQLRPTDFVQGLEGTGISVAFGQDYSKDTLGEQEFTLVFSKDGKTCSRTAGLYRFEIITEKTVALGQTYQPDIRDFVPDKNVAAQFVSTLPDPRSQAGVFPLVITCNGAAYEVTFVITENIAPTGSGKQVTVTVGENPHPSVFVDNVLDHTEVTFAFREDPRFDLVGERSVTVVLTDMFGNTTEVKSELIVEPHADGPRFEEMSTIYLQVGAAISYKTGVTVTDPQDGELTFTVDSGDFDNNTVGKYKVYYTAVDSDGHTVKVERYIVVETKETQMLRLAAEAVLNRIITPGMSREEKIHAIYEYTRWNVTYIGTSDKSSIENAAYEGFTQYKGDCYTYYAMIRVMLDLLEIPNVECQRIGGTSNHWWNLVEFEDGLYYHVDATPHAVTWMDEHFKLTESVIQQYTADPAVTNHRPNYYVYDHTLPQYQDIQIAQ